MSKINSKIYAYDINKNLINVYIDVRDNPEKLIQELQILEKEYFSIEKHKCTKEQRKPTSKKMALMSRESYYYWIREQFNTRRGLDKNINSNIKNSAYFIFLNKTGYRGLYRVGPNGYNVPYGNYKNPKITNSELIRNISKLIKDVHFRAWSYKKSHQFIQKNDFVYMDPPYYPLKKTSFVRYSENGFNKEDHSNLFKLSHKINCSFLMSNSNTEFVINSFMHKCYKIIQISAKRCINSKNPGKKASELLIFKSY